MSLIWLTGIKNLLDSNPKMANDEVLLGATFLKKFGYCPKINIKTACSTYKNLEGLMTFYDKHYDTKQEKAGHRMTLHTHNYYSPELIRKVIKSFRAEIKKTDIVVDWKKLNKEFQDRIKTMSDRQLVNAFNREVGNSGWVIARGIWLNLIHKEFENRGYDYSKIGDKNGLSFNNKIKLIGKKIIIDEI